MNHHAAPVSDAMAGWKRFQPHNDLPPHVPQLHLDRSGTILHATPTAQRLLEYDDEEALNPCFFTHVHGRNLHQVMQDMAHMVRQRKRKASWFLRLRTGNGRWRWFRAQASNKLYAQPPHIAVNLQPV